MSFKQRNQTKSKLFIGVLKFIKNKLLDIKMYT